MLISELLTPETVVNSLQGDKKLVFLSLLKSLKSAGMISNIDSCLRAVEEREATMSTGLGGGLGVPHARSEDLQNVVLALGISSDGIKYDALDGQPVFVVLLILSPVGGSEGYLAVLSEVSKLFMGDMELIQRLKSCKDSTEVLEMLRLAEEKSLAK